MAFVEQDCTIELQGRKFTAGGAIVTDDYVIGYPDGKGVLKTWHGDPLGTYRIVAVWRTPRSWVSGHMCQIEATVNGVVYTGRGAGAGMIYRGKRKSAR